MLWSRIPPGEPSTVGSGPPAILSCMVLYDAKSKCYELCEYICACGVYVCMCVCVYVCIHVA